MEPFSAPTPLDALTDTYPASDTMLQAIETSDLNSLRALARLWLSEGIPFAFRARPAIYEDIRRWLAHRLQIHSKEVTLIGSGRHGFSLGAGNVLGVAFGGHSDLDFTVISTTLFQRVADCFRTWAEDYTRGAILPRNEREKNFWEENTRNCPVGLKRGFIDPYKIPSRKQYRVVTDVMQSLWLIQKKLEITPHAPPVRHVSLRVYQDWEAFIKQMASNLEAVARKQKSTKRDTLEAS
jgi:hypothetical protein